MDRGDLEAVWPWADTPQGRARQRIRLDGIAEYLHIGGDSLSTELAAKRLGVHKRTIQRWRTALERARKT